MVFCVLHRNVADFCYWFGLGVLKMRSLIFYCRSEREKVKYGIPDWLRALTNASPEVTRKRTGEGRDYEEDMLLPLVRIRRVRKDFGPATKLIPSVMEAHQKLNKEEVLVLVRGTCLPTLAITLAPPLFFPGA